MPQGIVEHWHRPKKFRQQRTRILQFPTDMHGENLQIGRATSCGLTPESEVADLALCA